MGFNVGKIASVAGAAIGGYFGGPVGAAAGSNAGSFIGPSEQRLANREALSWYNRQLQDNITLWNMQNAYNSPVQQMNRLREAGLNPMLVYGSGSVDGNSASVPSGASAPRVQSSRKGDNSWIEKFFLNKSMENAQDQSRANALNEEYLSLRNDYMRTRITNALSKGKVKGSSKVDDGIDKRIKETRLAILEKQLALLGSGNGSIWNLNTWRTIGDALGESFANSTADFGSNVKSDLIRMGVRPR